MLSCIDFVHNAEDTAFVVNGCAGVGKTAMIVELTKALSITHNTVVASFTNRVVNNLKTKLHVNQSFSIPTMTLHSLLFSPVYDDDGNFSYLKENTEEEIRKRITTPFGIEIDQSVLIIDEASMVSFDMLEKIINKFPGPILFFGDNHQLPPVGCEEMNIMELPNINLKKICRVKEDNPIIQLSTEIRETGKYTRSKYKNLSEIGFIPKRKVNVEYLKDHQFDIILCGTNKERKKMNRIQRIAKGFSPDSPPQPGEQLIYLDRFRENHRSHIVAVSRTQTHYTREGQAYYDISLMGESEHIYVTPEFLHSEEYEDNFLYDEEGDKLKSPKMAPVAYAHAMTVHKAIGMEFDHVLFINDDVSFFLDQKKFTYTGVTRAKESITIAEKR